MCCICGIDSLRDGVSSDSHPLQLGAMAEMMTPHHARRQVHTDHLLSLITPEVWAPIYLDKRAHENMISGPTRETAA